MQDRAPSTLPLVNGELSPADAAQLEVLKNYIVVRSGFNCDSYKEKCVRRRIAVRMRAHGVHTYADYTAVVARDALEFQRLVDNLTINVSKFFRNPEVWHAIRTHIVPALFALETPSVQIWSAGCSSGEEAYSVAMELVLRAEHEQRTDALSRFRILGTDIDQAILERARAAGYGNYSLLDTPEEIRRRWFTTGKMHRLAPEIARMVTFDVGDLVTSAYPERQHLIMCRNVLIYFERSVQERMFERFRDALVPGGILVLGKVETLFGPAARGFRVLAGRERIFQKA